MSLQAKLDAIKKGAMDRIPADALKTMGAATDALRIAASLSEYTSSGAPSSRNKAALPSTWKLISS